MSPVLYHNAISTCSQKVRLALAEKGIAFESVELDLLAGEQKRPDYLALNPGGVVPTLVNGDDVVIESTVINEYLDDEFPESPLRPADTAARAAMRVWTKKIDESVHPFTVTLSFGIAFRLGVLNRSADEQQAFIDGFTDPARRERMSSLVRNGADSEFFPGAVHAADRVLAEMNATLARTPWLAGSEFSLADVAYVPFATRLQHLGLSRWWADKPALADWFARITARPSYQTAVVDWAPEPVVAGMGKAGAAAWPKIEALIAS
ncbi:MAG: glutathione S-transferase family protein [Gammaproteobacteria bacterium]|nr:glutathione S-transferase family protein [Gammaproteobacteria bacterium]